MWMAFLDMSENFLKRRNSLRRWASFESQEKMHLNQNGNEIWCFTCQNHFKLRQNNLRHKNNWFLQKIKWKSLSDCHSDVILTIKWPNLVVKCTAQVQTRDLLNRITSNFSKMISHWKNVKKWNKNNQIRFLTAAVTSFLTKKWPILSWNALLESKLGIYFSESLKQNLAKWSSI